MFQEKELDYLGFPGYKITSEGKVYSKYIKTKHIIGDKWKEIKGWTEKKGGYRMIKLVNKENKHKTMYLQRLILLAFIGVCPLGMEACHNDSNPQNNKLDNLRWDTPVNNTKDRTIRGTHIQNTGRGSKHGCSKLVEWKVEQIRKLCNFGYRKSDIAKVFKITPTTVIEIYKRKTWNHIK